MIVRNARNPLETKIDIYRLFNKGLYFVLSFSFTISHPLPVFSQMPFPSLNCLFPLLFLETSFMVTSYEYEALFKFPFSFICGGRTMYERLPSTSTRKFPPHSSRSENWRGKKKKKLFYLAKIYGKISKLSLDFAILSKLFKEYKGHIKPLENLFALAFISIFF